MILLSEYTEIIEMKAGARKNCGFSLVEVMIATGILTIGFAFIAGVFPVGIKLVASATETTMAPIVKQEAFAKIQLYGVDFASTNWPLLGRGVAYNEVSPAFTDPDEYDYPSAPVTADDKNYSWSAICRDVGGAGGDVQVRVFVSRKAGSGARPMPVKVNIEVVGSSPGPVVFEITETAKNDFIVPGSKLFSDGSGALYTVVSRDVLAGDVVQVEVESEISPSVGGSGDMWVVPPAVGGSRNPCIGVYQRTITF